MVIFVDQIDSRFKIVFLRKFGYNEFKESLCGSEHDWIICWIPVIEMPLQRSELCVYT